MNRLAKLSIFALVVKLAATTMFAVQPKRRFLGRWGELELTNETQAWLILESRRATQIGSAIHASRSPIIFWPNCTGV